MPTRDVELATPDGAMRAYEARPDQTPRAAVIVIAEAFGVNDHIEDVTRRFAAEGFLAVAPDIFHRSGGGTASYDDFRGAMGLFRGLDDAGLLVDIDAVRDHLADEGFADRSVGIVGFCFGGRVSFLAGVRRPLGAVVTYYGGGMISTGVIRGFGALIDEVGDLQAPWLGLFGDQDESIPVDDVELLRSRLDADAAVPHEIVRYADAGHAFHCDARGSYHEPSARDAWRHSVRWLRGHLEPTTA
jgi:carboxymethylenebutenolidase